MRIKTIIGASVLAAAGVLAAAPAMASYDTDCPVGYMCMWADNDYKNVIGHRVAGYETIYNLTGSTADNDMDSWANRSTSYVGCMYADANGGGDKQTMAKNTRDNNVASWNSDEVTSWRSINGC
jgi:hypothetical protein